MQDVTDLRFMRLIAGYGNADLYFTEYFRVLPDSRLDPQILASITQNPTGRPVIAQMIGNDITALVRTARELQQHPVAAIDLNLADIDESRGWNRLAGERADLGGHGGCYQTFVGGNGLR